MSREHHLHVNGLGQFLFRGGCGLHTENSPLAFGPFQVVRVDEELGPARILDLPNTEDVGLIPRFSHLREPGDALGNPVPSAARQAEIGGHSALNIIG